MPKANPVRLASFSTAGGPSSAADEADDTDGTGEAGEAGEAGARRCLRADGPATRQLSMRALPGPVPRRPSVAPRIDGHSDGFLAGCCQANCSDISLRHRDRLMIAVNETHDQL
ncbi:hypothetical protein [Streptomyces sp. KL116D]|uniref:hypothetical protein n=1 Tax=Streptomyces sp. KL116D TaxID=3045152 RepID=UPI003557900B